MRSTEQGADPDRVEGRLSSDQLRDFYRGEYVDRFDAARNDRLVHLSRRIDWRQDDRVLDCACGSGKMLELIRGRVRRYVGVDFSEEFIARARARQSDTGATNAEFVCADLAEFCAEHVGQFSKVLAFDFTEHIYDDAFIDVFRAVRGVLAPGGCLYVHTPNRTYFLEILKSAGLLKGDPTHIGVRTGPQMRELLQRSGFDAPKVEYLAHYVSLLRGLHFAGRLPLLGRLFLARLFITCEMSGREKAAESDGNR